MAKTRRQLIDTVLGKAGILVPGQSPGDEIVSRVDGYIDPVFAELAALDYYYVSDGGLPNPPSGGDIEDAAFNALADYVLGACAGELNLAGDPAIKVAALEAVVTLRLISRPAKTRPVLTTDAQLRGMRPRTPLSGNFQRGS
jgi:hypothetical protein